MKKPVYGRMFQTPFADTVRMEVGIPTMSVGNIYSPDHVNTILLQGRSDLVALARPHLVGSAFTAQAAAWYDYRGHKLAPAVPFRPESGVSAGGARAGRVQADAGPLCAHRRMKSVTSESVGQWVGDKN